jgi:hypothetical protein
MRRFLKSFGVLCALLPFSAIPPITPSFANDGLDRWGGIVFFCGAPIPAQPWGPEACAAAQAAAETKAAELGVPIATVDAGRAGITGGPESSSPAFEWGKALRLLANFEKSQSASYPWNMMLLLYDHPADANGERLESRYQVIFQQSVSLVDGDELKGVHDTAPQLVGGYLDQLFKQ